LKSALTAGIYVVLLAVIGLNGKEKRAVLRAVQRKLKH